MGYVESEDEHSDFVIYNTCTVRENANNEVYGRLDIFLTSEKSDMVIALCGCMMQEPTVVKNSKSIVL